MKQQLSMKRNGFTLVELVTVIVILGVLATGLSSFIRFGTQAYVEATQRDELIASARFAIERLNREIRSALPNSSRVISNLVGTKQCLEYTPIISTGIYTDIPVAPEAISNEIFMVPSTSLSNIVNIDFAINPLSSDDIYNNFSGVIATVASVNQTPDRDPAVDPEAAIITMTQAKLFNGESATNRVYFISSAISYCVENQSLYRYSSYSRAADNTPNADGDKVLMAEYINNSLADLPFSVADSTLTRNALVKIKFNFSRNFEEIVFNNEIQVPNVP